MANTITKAQLEAQVTELREALAAAQARTTDLEQQLESHAAEAQEPERRDQLEQIVWLRREAPSFEGETMRWSQDGRTLLVRLATQYATLDRKTGKRLYGERKWFTVIGELAERVRDHYATSDVRLARIGAYERPQPPVYGTRAQLEQRGFTPLAEPRGALIGNLADGTPVYESASAADNGEQLFRVGGPRSEWILASFEPMPRLDAPAQPVQAAASAPLAEPTSEEIPF